MTEAAHALKRAAFDGNLDEVRSLVEAGANVNATDENGAGSLLSFHPHVVAYLLSQGADPDKQKNEYGASVLAGLCYVNQMECVRLLLDHGANPNLGRKESGETPLHHGLAGDAGTPLVQLLIENGADIDAKTKSGIRSYNFFGDTPTRGETPLHRAAAYSSFDTVRLLLDSGADYSIADNDNYLPYHWAGWHRRPKDLVELLRP